MKTKPWPLIVLAILQLLSPLATVLFNAWLLDVGPGYVWGWILEKPFLKIFESLALMPIAGIALLWMRPWSYAIFFGAVLWSFGSNLLNFNYASQFGALGILILIYAMQLGLALYFLIPAVRRTYFDASVRWWEAKRRYLLKLPATLQMTGDSQKHAATLLNISEGGVLLETKAPLLQGTVFQLGFQILGVPFAIRADTVYVGARNAGGDGSGNFGVRFLPEDSKQEARFGNLIQGLDLIGLVDRDGASRKPFLISIWDWFIGIFKTGKGLLPEFKGDRRS